MEIRIRALTRGDLDQFNAHFGRHRAESGRGDIHFMPFDPDHTEGPRGLDPAALQKPLDAPGWQRWFAAFETDGRIVGHIDLTGDGLRTGLHRCELGIGIERPYRGMKLGRRLMHTAITFARGIDSLEWIELRVFAHNEGTRALYRSLGFEEVATITDRFRIGGMQIDDVLMTLKVR